MAYKEVETLIRLIQQVLVNFDDYLQIQERNGVLVLYGELDKGKSFYVLSHTFYSHFPEGNVQFFEQEENNVEGWFVVTHPIFNEWKKQPNFVEEFKILERKINRW